LHHRKLGIEVDNDSRIIEPHADETKHTYVLRLEGLGHSEMLIRKGLVSHFSMKLAELGDFLEDYADARLRHVATIIQKSPTRSHYSLCKKLSRDLGIPMARAEAWITRSREIGQSA
jgi:hypothetical protein